MSYRAQTTMRLVRLAVLLVIVAWGLANWRQARQARRAGAALHEALAGALDNEGSLPSSEQKKVLAAAAELGGGDFDGAAATLGCVRSSAFRRLFPPKGGTTNSLDPQAAAGRFFAGDKDLEKRFLAAVEAGKKQENEGADVGAVRNALADAVSAAAEGDRQAVDANIRRAERSLDRIGMGSSAATPGNTEAEVAVLLERIGPAYQLGSDLVTEGHAAVEKLVGRASREYKAGRLDQAALLLETAAGLLGVQGPSPAAAAVPEWFKRLANPAATAVTEARAEAVVNLSEAMAASETPSKPVSMLIEKARRELDAGRPEDACWWASVALNAMGMTDDAVAAAAGE